MTDYRIIWTALSASVVLTACSSSETTVQDIPTFGPNGEPPVVVAAERKLSPVGSEEAFYDALRQALIAQNQDYYGYPTVDGITVDALEVGAPVAPVASPEAPAEPPQSAPVAESDAGSADTSAVSSDQALDVTGTNVQEIGVDEQDLVKTDGEFLYVLKREYQDYYPGPTPLPVDDPEPVIVDEPDRQSRLSIAVPQAVDNTLRILSLQPDVPDASVLSEITLDNTGLSATGLYLYKKDDSASIVMASSSGYGYYDYWDDSYSFNGSRSALTRVDVTNPSLASVTDTITIDGQIISSRRIGNQLFFASRHYPAIPNVSPYSVTPDQWEEIVNSADLSAVLPQYRNNGTEQVTPLVSPADCFVAQQVEDQYYTPDIISLVTVNLDSMQVSDAACYLGSSETLYASPDSVYLATTRWDYGFGIAETDIAVDVVEPGVPADSDEPIFVETSMPYDPRIDTDIHKFSIGEGRLDYEGSGTVNGHLGWNSLRMPYRMSEHDGRLRVVTHSAFQNAQVSPVIVSVLAMNGLGELAKVSELPNASRPEHIGKPFEDLYATRFLGNQVYLVTFRQTDPLYAIDLSNPSDPYIAGELEIDGYSDFLQPVGEGFLLGIGKDAIANPNGGGAFVQGVKLSLFDVRNPQDPKEVQALVVGQRGTESGALYDQRGITVQMANELHPTRVSISMNVHGETYPSRPTIEEATNYYSYSYTGLHGFDITVGDNAAITAKGALRVDTGNDYYYGAPISEDRSVIVNDATYYIHQSNVYSADWNDLSNSLGPR